MPRPGTNKFAVSQEAQAVIDSTQGPLKFWSKREAARFFDCDVRTLHRVEHLFVIDKDPARNPHAKLLTCRSCKKPVPTAEGRTGYCAPCRALGEGRKAQGKWMSAKQSGANNSNYVDGSSRSGWRQSKEGRLWVEQVEEVCSHECAVSGLTDSLHAHHILPVALFPQYKAEPWNGVLLDDSIHIELHRHKLDVVLLPILFESGLDARQLRQEFCHLPQVRKLLPLAGKPQPEHELIRVVSSNYRKTARDCLPESFLQEHFRWA